MNILAQFAVNGIVAGSVYALIALGFALIFTASRVFHFAHGGVYTLSAFAGYTALVTFKLGLVPASSPRSSSRRSSGFSSISCSTSR